MSDRHASISRALGLLSVLLFISTAQARGQASQPEKSQEARLHWLAFPDESRFKLLGLFWHKENSPQLWRMPKGRFDALPKGVQSRAKAPSGGRILIRCDTTKLGLEMTSPVNGGRKSFDVYINGRPFKPAIAERPDASRELVLFDELGHDPKEIVIYLPYRQETLIEAIGVDPGTKFDPPEHKYARPLPVVFYGSSVCQGSAASTPGLTYEAITCRQLDLDFINLGFGGAGKAEKAVVDLVASIPACCYVFDLGKSYGMQDASAYKAMLQTVRAKHPGVPIVCITPITSRVEVRDQDYSRKSVHTRTVMREAVAELIGSGEKKIFLIEGTDLLGFREQDGLSKDGVHPSDDGFNIIAAKLVGVLRQAIGIETPRAASGPLKSF